MRNTIILPNYLSEYGGIRTHEALIAMDLQSTSFDHLDTYSFAP